MAKSEEEKIVDIVTATEEVADEILVNKQALIDLDNRRQYTRVAIREIEKNCADEKKLWITLGNTLVKMEREFALEMLKKDQVVIDAEINKIRSDQKILLNKHRDLEQLSPYSGTNLKAMDRRDFDALRVNLPGL